MKIISPLPRKRGRIEIIPLIDIMFFLLAAFMVVSINKIKVKSLKVSLPTDVPVSQLEPKEDFVSVSINSLGQVQIDKELIADPTAILPKLQELYAKNNDQKILISADRDARNGDVIAVLGKLRIAGFQKVAFNLKGGTGVVPGGGGVGGPPPAASTAPGASPAPGATAPAAASPAPLGPSTAPGTPANTGVPSAPPAGLAVPAAPVAPAPPAAPAAPTAAEVPVPPAPPSPPAPPAQP